MVTKRTNKKDSLIVNTCCRVLGLYSRTDLALAVNIEMHLKLMELPHKLPTMSHASLIPRIDDEMVTKITAIQKRSFS